MARTTNTPIFVGEDVDLSFTIYTTDTGSTPEDISGWTFSLVIGHLNTTTKILTKAGAIVLPASGTLTVTLLAADTSALAPGLYHWDLWRTNAGFARVLAIGDFELKPTVRLP